MSFQSTLRDFLLGDATLTALVGDRIFPTTLEQNCVLPAIVYFRVSGRTEHKPVSASVGRTRNFTVQIQAIGRDYDETDSVEEAVYARLNEDDPAKVLSCRPLGETQDLYDEDTHQYITASDYSCWYTPSS